MTLSRVDLPAPLAPMMAIVSPSSTASDTSKQGLEVAVEAADPLDVEEAHPVTLWPR